MPTRLLTRTIQVSALALGLPLGLACSADATSDGSGGTQGAPGGTGTQPSVRAAGGKASGSGGSGGNIESSWSPGGRAGSSGTGSSAAGTSAVLGKPGLAGGAPSTGAAGVAGGGTGGRVGAETPLVSSGAPGSAGVSGIPLASGGAGPQSGTTGGRGPVGGAGAPAGTPGGPITVHIAGDSTVSSYADTGSTRDQAGWGQMLSATLNSRVTVNNQAIGGRTARRFIDEGRLTTLLNAIKPGDYLLVQFGTNDGNKTATYDLNGQAIPYYLDPKTDFVKYLQQYIDGVRAKQATPVLVTPPPRNSAYCTGGNGTGAHAQAMRDLGPAQGVAVVDLNAATVAYLKAICPAPTPEDFFLLKADGSVDGTHFQSNGARKLAEFVAAGIRESGLPLADYLK